MRDYWLVSNDENRLELATGMNIGNASNIYIWLTKEQGAYKRLVIGLTPVSSVFIENSLIHCSETRDEVNFSVDSLLQSFGKSDSLLVSIYDPQRRWGDCSVFLLARNEAVYQEQTDERAPQERASGILFSGQVVIALMIILLCLGLFRYMNPKTLDDLMNVSHLFSPRFRIESDVERNLLTTSFLVFILILSGMVAYLLEIYQQVRPMSNTSAFQWSQGDTLVRWLSYTALIFISLIGKYILLTFISGLFGFQHLRNNYFFEFIRISFVGYALGLVLVIVLLFGFRVDETMLYDILFFVLLIFMLTRTSLLYLKVKSGIRAKLVHIISYLCPIEFVPVLLLFNYLLE
jgi:hypothetical protein